MLLYYYLLIKLIELPPTNGIFKGNGGMLNGKFDVAWESSNYNCISLIFDSIL